MRSFPTLVLAACALLSVSILAHAQQPPVNAFGEPAHQTVGIKTEISPKETQIYVDGFYRGTAGDFGGFSKKLRLEPGSHEFVLYLKGYKTIRQTLDVKPGDDYKLREKMVALAAGETSEPPPTAPTPTAAASERRAAPAGQPSPGEPRPRAPRPPRPPRPEPSVAPANASGFGSLVVRAQPAGSEVLIDGERWHGTDDAAPLVVQVPAGSHRVEIRKDGYQSFAADVDVREGERTPVNVSLTRQ